MVKVHRDLLKRLESVRAVNLDTAYGFQENVPQMTEKLVEHFATSLRTELAPLHFTSFEQSTELERAVFKERVRDATYVFAGPGSPSYALKQWTPLELAADLAQVLSLDGTLCFASAAALTLGAFTVPVYEIYKVGDRPRWLDGLNVMALLGLNCVVIPHFDNKEGGNYDTRFCYLGEKRLIELEGQLPDGVATLGVDEHTALVLNLQDDTLEVRGRAHGYWRLNGTVEQLTNGSTTALESLRTLVPSTAPSPANAGGAVAADSLVQLGELVAEGGPTALAALAQLLDRASRASQGFVDPAPLVEGILAARVTARGMGQYELADELRRVLVGAGFEVRDGPTGTTWTAPSS